VGDGVATKMGLAAFRREIQRRGTLHRLVGRYAQALLAAMIQTSACDRLHPLRQRCSRWLLETHDRIHRDEFQLSHEFLAVMLGVHRPTVTVIAGALQKAALIHYRHGHITVIDRDSRACHASATRRSVDTSIDAAKDGEMRRRVSLQTDRNRAVGIGWSSFSGPGKSAEVCGAQGGSGTADQNLERPS
jgi:hypothetical protein